MREFTAIFPFGGSGGGALGFKLARGAAHGLRGRFRILGGLDFDKVACEDFEAFVGSPSHHVDIQDVTPEDLRAWYGVTSPDVVFMSPPCKGSSSLLSRRKAVSAKYQAMNRLAVVWARVMLAAWNEPPSLVLLENVPGLPARAPGMLAELDHLMAAAGYVAHAADHDCGEIGGLAQHRRRHLRVWRHPERCPPLLFQPPRLTVRGVGEVLSLLPMPATLAAQVWGPLHTMSRLSWTNWLRLASIPAGGDWRDLAGVLDGRARREVFRRHAVQAWTEPHPTVTGPGGHSVERVADPRVALPEGTAWHSGAMGVRAWEEPSGTVTGGCHPSKGVFSVADIRVQGQALHRNKHQVVAWDGTSPTVIGKGQPSSGAPAVADVRVSRAYDAGYGVLRWDEPARTVAGTTAVGCGAYAVADAREGWASDVRVMTLDEAFALDLPGAKPPPFTPVIIAEDGTWHRPMTPRELSAIQGYPLTIDGAPIPWAGTRTLVGEHIGNSVPPPAAQAIAEQMLSALLTAAAAGWSLAGGDTPVWVDGERVLHALG